MRSHCQVHPPGSYRTANLVSDPFGVQNMSCAYPHCLGRRLSFYRVDGWNRNHWRGQVFKISEAVVRGQCSATTSRAVLLLRVAWCQIQATPTGIPSPLPFGQTHRGNENSGYRSVLVICYFVGSPRAGPSCNSHRTTSRVRCLLHLQDLRPRGIVMASVAALHSGR